MEQKKNIDLEIKELVKSAGEGLHTWDDMSAITEDQEYISHK